MALNFPNPGVGSVAEYQAAGIPACGEINGDTDFNLSTVTFTYATKAITVWALDPATTVSFDGGTTELSLVQNVPTRIEVKTNQIIAGSSAQPTRDHRVQFIAELTAIPGGKIPAVTTADWVVVS